MSFSTAVPLGKTISKVVDVLLLIAKVWFSMLPVSIALVNPASPDVLLEPIKLLSLASAVVLAIVTALPFASVSFKLLDVAVAVKFGIPLLLIASIMSNGEAIIAVSLTPV